VHAVRASQLGAKVAIIEVKKSFGGPTGLTSKAVREAAKRIIKTVDQVCVPFTGLQSQSSISMAFSCTGRGRPTKADPKAVAAAVPGVEDAGRSVSGGRDTRAAEQERL
jgi:hypothetical protein